MIRFIAGKSSDKHGRVIVMFFSSLVMMLSMVILSITHSLPMMIFGAGIFGLSLGMNSPTLAAWGVDLCRVENRGKAVASVYIALEAGIGSGAIFSAWIFGNRIENFVYAFLFPGLLSLAAMILLLIWRKQGRSLVASFQIPE